MSAAWVRRAVAGTRESLLPLVLLATAALLVQREPRWAFAAEQRWAFTGALPPLASHLSRRLAARYQRALEEAMASTGRSARALDLAALALAFAAGLWIAVGEAAVEQLIARAYRGESWAVWNGIFSGRHSLPLEHYLAVWRRGATGITLVLIAAAGLAALLARRAVQARLERQLALEQATWDASAAPLSAARRRIANIVIGGLVFGSVAAIATDREVWPFCTYGMYSGIVDGDELSLPRVYGIPREPGASELALFSASHLHPFDPSRLWVALARLEHTPSPSDAYRDALANLLALYRAAREAGRHDGPELRGLRLYRVRWELDPWARNVDRPESRELLAEHFEPPLEHGAAR